MTDIVIHVENLSKRYRIGLKEQMHHTLGGAVADLVTRPVKNFRRIRQLSSFSKNGHNEDVIWALKDVSLEVKKGEAVGIIGRNGSGKSTLLKILARITEPTEGYATINGRVGSLLEVGTGFHPELTGRENVYLNGAILGMTRKEVERKFDEIVDFSGVEKLIDTTVKRYSSGMKVRLAFAVAAHLDPEILLVDEVLAVGDAEFQRKCLGKMGDVTKGGRTVLFVSHNLAAIHHLCSRGLLLDAGKLIYAGSSADAVAEYEQLLYGTSTPSFPSHVLFQSTGQRPQSAFEIVKVEILDSDGHPRPMVYTWDSFVLRIHYRAREYIREGSAVIMLSSLFGTPLLLLSTQPDSAVQMAIEIGEHTVDCYIREVPLAAGDYVIGAGLAVPNRQWLYKEENLARLTIHGRDVFGSGLAPTSSRAILAVPHVWRIKENADEQIS